MEPELKNRAMQLDHEIFKAGKRLNEAKGEEEINKAFDKLDALEMEQEEILLKLGLESTMDLE